jgi:lipid-A-disaccharide synthase
MMPPLADFVDRMHALPEYSDYKFIIAGAPSRSKEDYSTLLSGREDFVKIVFSETYAVVKHASAAVINSGTASLEAAIIGTPQVVCYSSSTLSFLIARQIIRSKYISLGNLILQRQAFKEFIQYYATGENILVEIRRILEDSSYRETMLSDYAEIRSALGGRGASERVASAMVKELQ